MAVRTRAGHVAGCGAALAMTPYFVIKVVWTVDGLRGGGLHDGAWSRLDWAALNGLTVIMAGTAIVVGLALALPWGLRVPGWLVTLPAWVGTGFLVPMIPILPVLVLTGGGDDGGPAPAMPAWEAALVSVSFAGFGLGVAVAFPLYVRRRWPYAATGRPPHPAAAGLAVAVAGVLGLVQLYWALGGTAGLDPAALGGRDTQWHVLTGNSGAWALTGAAALWAVTVRGGGAVARLLVWVASGMAFAWGSWKTVLAYAVTTPETPWALAVVNHFGALAGAVMLLLLLDVVPGAGPAVRPRSPVLPSGVAR